MSPRERHTGVRDGMPRRHSRRVSTTGGTETAHARSVDARRAAHYGLLMIFVATPGLQMVALRPVSWRQTVGRSTSGPRRLPQLEGF